MADPELLAACTAKHAGRVALQLFATWLSEEYRPTKNLESPSKIWCGESPEDHGRLSIMPQQCAYMRHGRLDVLPNAQRYACSVGKVSVELQGTSLCRLLTLPGRSSALKSSCCLCHI